MQGDRSPLPLRLRVALGATRQPSADRLEFVRARLRTAVDGHLAIAPDVHANQSSGAATSLATSDGVLFLPAGEAPLEAGEAVDFVRWSDL